VAFGTAVPPHDLDQALVREVAEQLVEEQAPDHADVLSVFANAGIESRSIARPLDFYLGSPGWSERSEAYEDAGTELAVDVAEACLDHAGLVPDAIDGIVFVNTTGLSTPSLETCVANELDLAPSTLRVPVWGLGCAGGVAGLARAGDLARAHPGKRFLLVSLELCSLAFLREELSKKLVVASALFGDGAAGALVAGDGLEAEGPGLAGSASHLWSDTEDVMGWEVKDAGLDVVFSPEIPDIVSSHLDEVVPPFLKRQGTRTEDVRAAFHPGGPKVLQAYEEALDLAGGKLSTARSVLRDHGNMSSPTALFVLDRMLEDPLAPGEEALLAAVGPGFAAELSLLRGA
jgi:alkylresorcinol/alkylpyrone synthase